MRLPILGGRRTLYRREVDSGSIRYPVQSYVFSLAFMFSVYSYRQYNTLVLRSLVGKNNTINWLSSTTVLKNVPNFPESKLSCDPESRTYLILVANEVFVCEYQFREGIVAFERTSGLRSIILLTAVL